MPEKYWEIVYETGAHSVISVDDEEDAMQGIQSHHDRATSGEPGGPTGHPAERVVAVYEFDTHPGEDQEVNANADAHGSKYEGGTPVNLDFLEA